MAINKFHLSVHQLFHFKKRQVFPQYPVGIYTYIRTIFLSPSQAAFCMYREDFNSLDEFTALRFTVTGVPPAARRLRILPMNQPITFGMK
jgi:hypothetical protein